MELPPTDIFREPFVIPLGHLTMQAAYAEKHLISLCAGAPGEGKPAEMSEEEAAHALRNWDQSGKAFALERANLIAKPHLRDSAIEAIDRYDALRLARHRAIHDAISIGIFEEGEKNYAVRPLAVEYRRTGKATTTHIREITPEAVADLAMQLNDVQKTFEFIVYAINSSPPGKPEFL
jgi:hypothetical protein